MIWIERIIALAVMLQTLEALSVTSDYSDKGVWAWSILKKDYLPFPPWFRWIMDRLMRESNFKAFLKLRLVASVFFILVPNPWLAAFLLFTTLLIAWRWRGTFNGGSDGMTTQVLLGLSVSLTFPASVLVMKGAVAWIALQSALSYFIAGFVKFKNPFWRNGQALQKILVNSAYQVPSAFRLQGRNQKLCAALSWSIFVFELLFPLSLLRPAIFWILVPIGILFHLANARILGLNRFLFAWMATYPAIYLVSTWA